jgi:drug/metabolite transporter (DMT)-like permease
MPLDKLPQAWLWTIFIVAASATQLAFKWAGTELDDLEFGPAFIKAALTKPSVWVAILGYLGMFVLWLTILKRTPLSRAFLITAVVYVPVTLGAWLIFGEHISALRAVGTAAIMAGVVLIGSAPTS